MHLFKKKPKPTQGQSAVFAGKGILPEPADPKNPISPENPAPGNPLQGAPIQGNLNGSFNLLAQIQQTLGEDYTDQLFSDETDAPFVDSLDAKQLLTQDADGSDAGLHALGPESRLSQSCLWEMHEAYYARLGVSAWDGVVPCFVTTSAFIAEAYGEMIINFLQDYDEHLDRAEPVYIVEMASGVGRFSFLLMKELEAKLAYFSRLKDLEIRYIMTDFTENNLNYWRQHEKFQPYIEKGMLDFAVFRPEEETSLHLLHSGKKLSAQSIHNPLIAIANYFFDSIRQDIFRVSNHTLQEGLVTLARQLPENGSLPPTDDPPPFSEIKARYRYQDVSPGHYYDQLSFNGILQEYKDTVKNGTIIFPVGALRVIRNLQTLSNGNLVLLSSDKAFAAKEHMLLYNRHDFAAHGSFSYMVNYDAIGRYFANQGGVYFPSANWGVSVQTVCCIATRKQGVPMERMKYYFDRQLNMANPISSIARILPDEGNGLSRLLAFLRVSLCDPRVFCGFARQIVDFLPSATLEEKHDLLRLMELCGEKYYFYRGERNLPYWFAEIYYHLNLQEKSLHYLEEAMKGYAEYRWEYCYLKGRCHEKLNQWPQARQAYEEALSLKPDYEESRMALEGIRCLSIGESTADSC